MGNKYKYEFERVEDNGNKIVGNLDAHNNVSGSLTSHKKDLPVGKVGSVNLNNGNNPTNNGNGGFSYDDPKPQYTGTYGNQINDLITQILNREKFSYNFNEDALYQQYKDKYSQQAKMAMADAIGTASAMTGGYNNSYAQSVGQQQYAAQMQNLNDVIPELYNLALDKYNMEGNELYNQASLLSAQDQIEYGRHRDEVSDWYNDRNFDYQKYLDDRNYNYQVGRDAVNDYQWLIGQTPEVEETVAPTIIPSREYWKDDYDLDPSGYTYYVNGKEVTVGYNVNPFTGNTNPDTANGTIEGRPYQPNNVEGKPLTKTKATDVINGKEEPIWVDEDGNKWIWNDMTNEYDLYKE